MKLDQILDRIRHPFRREPKFSFTLPLPRNLPAVAANEPMRPDDPQNDHGQDELRASHGK